MKLKRFLKKTILKDSQKNILQTTHIPAKTEDLDATFFNFLYQQAVEWHGAYHADSV